MEILPTWTFENNNKTMTTFKWHVWVRVSNFFSINSSWKWWLFQCFFRPFIDSPSHNLKKKKNTEEEEEEDKPDPTWDQYFSGWVRFLPDKPNYYQIRLWVAVKPTRPDPISVQPKKMVETCKQRRREISR